MKSTGDYLSSHGIRPSVQRLAIYRYLDSHRIHPSADVVFTALHDDMPTLSRTTVYNTLRLFCDKGVAQLLTLREDEMRFDADTSVHAHFQCEKCGVIFDFVCGAGSPVNCRPPVGFDVHETRIYLRGICADCRTPQAAHKNRPVG